MEVSKALAFEAGPEICHKNLRSLVEADCAALEAVPVVKTWEVVHQQVDECSRGAVGFVKACDKAAIKLLEAINIV
jgi:hypothetical protein